VRTDRERHRPLPDDSHQVQAISVLARAHQDAIWLQSREVNRLRSLLREFFPAALQVFADLTTRSALAILHTAPTPAAAAVLDADGLRRVLLAAGRRVIPRRELERLLGGFAFPQLRQPELVEKAMGEAVRAIVTGLAAVRDAIAQLSTA